MSVKSGNKHKNRNGVALSALAAGLLAAYIAPAYAVDVDISNNFGSFSSSNTDNQIQVYNGDFKVGTSGSSSASASGSGSPGDPPYIVNNGNGTSTVYTVTNIDASTTTTDSITGGVLLEENGNITGTGGATTTTITTYDLATSFLVTNSDGLPIIGTTMTGIVGDYTGGVFTPNVTQTSTTIESNEGGNLVMSGNGTFGGDLYVAGTIYGNGTDGALTLHGGTASTSITIDNNGVNIADSVNGQTFNLDNAGNVLAAGNVTADSFITGNTTLSPGQLSAVDNMVIQADSNSGGVGAIVLQKGATTLATFDSTGAELYTALDMNGNNINGVGTITATTGNITTINSTTINNSGTVNTSHLDATTAQIGELDFATDTISGPDDIVLNADAPDGGYGSIQLQKAGVELARFDENADGGAVIQTNTTVQGTTTLNGATTVNNSFTVDTNGGSANVTGTGRVVVQTNSASFGVQNAGGNLNGITANTTGTVVRGGTNSSTLTLQQNSAVLDSGASSNVSLSSNYASVYGYSQSQVTNAYGSGFQAYYDNAYMYSNNYTEVYGGVETMVSGGGSTMTLNSDGATFAAEGTGSPIRVHGVADGKANHDAVNVSQLKGLREDLSGGIASTIAMTNIPHVDESKTFAVGIGYGNYDGENGYALGGSYRFMGSGVLKASVAGSDSGETAWGVGAGMSW